MLFLCHKFKPLGRLLTRLPRLNPKTVDCQYIEEVKRHGLCNKKTIVTSQIIEDDRYSLSELILCTSNL